MLKKLAVSVLGLGFLMAPAFALAQSTNVADQVAALLAQIKQLQALIVQLQSGSQSSCLDLQRTLTLGSGGVDVSQLQNYLIAKGDLDAGNNTGYFGFLTAQAVGKLQLSLGLVTSENDPAYGFAGPKTRAAIACNNTKPQPSIPPTPIGLSASPTIGAAPLYVTFSITTVNPADPNSSYSVNFGDGNSSPMQRSGFESVSTQVAHTYQHAGTYAAQFVKNFMCTAPQGAPCMLPEPQVLGTKTITVMSTPLPPSPSATIDQSSLSVANGGWFSINGSAHNVTSVYVEMVPSSYTGNTDWQAVNNVYRAALGVTDVINYRWSVSMTNASNPYTPGDYVVYVYDANSKALLTSGALTITAGTTPPPLPAALIDSWSGPQTIGAGSTVSLKSENAFSGAHARSLSLWFNSSYVAHNQPLFDAGSCWVGNNGFQGFITVPGEMGNGIQMPASDPGGVYLVMWNNDIYVPLGASTFANGSWHHLVVTYDGTNAVVYVDGALSNAYHWLQPIWSGLRSQPITVGQLNTPQSNILIGASRCQEWYHGNTYFQGQMGKVAVYSGALTQAQVSNLYSQGAPVGGPQPTGTINQSSLSMGQNFYGATHDITGTISGVSTALLELKGISLQTAVEDWTSTISGSTWTANISSNLQLGNYSVQLIDKDTGPYSGSVLASGVLVVGGITSLGACPASVAVYRGQNSTTYSCTCPTNGVARDIWGGPGYYTDNSDICTAGAQDGQMNLVSGGLVDFTIGSGQSSYTGFTQNAITSLSYGSWPGSFSITGPKACLAAGTAISMSDGSHANIEDIQVGDLVKSFNGGKTTTAVVTNVMQREDPIITINGALEAAPDEVVYLAKGTMETADHLRVGDQLLSEDGRAVTVTTITSSSKLAKTYDLALENGDAFFADGYLVQSLNASLQ